MYKSESLQSQYSLAGSFLESSQQTVKVLFVDLNIFNKKKISVAKLVLQKPFTTVWTERKVWKPIEKLISLPEYLLIVSKCLQGIYPFDYMMSRVFVQYISTIASVLVTHK